MGLGLFFPILLLAMGIYVLIGAVKGSGRLFSMENFKDDSRDKAKKYMRILYFALAAVFFALTCAATFTLHCNEDRAYSVPALSADAIACPAESDKLMIVAHPDDETLWGGAHLLDGLHDDPM